MAVDNQNRNPFRDVVGDRFNTQRGFGINPGIARDGTPINASNVGQGQYVVDNATDQDINNGLFQTSTNILVKSNGSVIGLIQSFTQTENRNINKLAGIGFEGVMQAVPANTDGGQLRVSRIALYNTRLADIFGINETMRTYNDGPDNVPAFVTLRNQRIPFEIEVWNPTDMNDGDSAGWQIDTYIDCWISSWSRTYSVDQIYVVEDTTITYSDVR